MALTLVVIHERLGNWARQLRRRLADGVGNGGSTRFVESRSTESLERAVAGLASPIVVIDLAERPEAMLGDLLRAAKIAPNGFFLVLDSQSQPGVALLAREMGATHVISGWAAPPDVAAVIERWLPLAKCRGDRDGWSVPQKPAPEPWDVLDSPPEITAPFAPDSSQVSSDIPSRFALARERESP